MAYDDGCTVYTLTQNGWQPGEEHPDAVEKWKRSVRQASPWSREYVSWSCQWVSQDFTRAERDQLRELHQYFMGKAGIAGNRETTIGSPL